MRLTGDEARKWLEENPNAAFTDNMSGTAYNAPTPQKNNILQTLSKPFRQGAGVAEEFGLTLGDLVKMLRGENVDPNARADNGYKYAFLNEDESRQLASDPLKQGLKSGAGVAAYGVGGGGMGGAIKGATPLARITSAAKLGAAGGGLSSFGASESGDELLNTLKGVGLGGVLGGGLQAAGEGVKALGNIKPKAQSTGELSRAQKYLAKQRGEAIGLDPNKLAKGRGTGMNSATEGNKAIEGFFSSMDELGLPTRTSNIASESADQALSIYGENFNKLLASADESTMFNAVDTKNILDRITKEVGNNPNVMKASTVKELMADLAGLGNNYTPSQLNGIREKARGMINWSRSGNKMPMTERGVKSIFDSIDDFFKASIPESGETLSKMSNIYTVRPYIQGKAQLGDVIKVGTASTNIGIPTAGVNEAIQSGVGKLAQGVPTAGGADLSAIQSLLGTTGKGVQSVAPQIAGQMMSGSQPQAQQMQPVQGQPQQDQQTQALQYALADAIYSGQISATEAEAIMGLLGMSGGMGGGELSANQSKSVALQGSLDKLRSAWENTGGGGKLMETLGINVGSNVRSLDQAKAAVVEDLGRLQSQGAINEGERREFESMMPNSWDSPQVVEQKLQSIQNRINAYL